MFCKNNNNNEDEAEEDVYKRFFCSQTDFLTTRDTGMNVV